MPRSRNALASGGGAISSGGPSGDAGSVTVTEAGTMSARGTSGLSALAISVLAGSILPVSVLTVSVLGSVTGIETVVTAIGLADASAGGGVSNDPLGAGRRCVVGGRS